VPKERIYIFGAGNIGKKAYMELKGKYDIPAFIDNDPAKQGGWLFGIPVLSPNALKNREHGSGNGIVVIASLHKRAIYLQLTEDYGCPNVTFYEWLAYEEAENRDHEAPSPDGVGSDGKNVIVSLTCHGARLKTADICIKSIFAQSYKPDRIILWFGNDVKAEDIGNLQALESHGLQIRWAEGDLKSHKKYFYAMKEYFDDIVITIDDDVIYDRSLIRSLMESYARHPNAVSARRTHRMRKFEGRLLPYGLWDFEQTEINCPSMELFATGIGGVLYPPRCMGPKVFDEELIKSLCPCADDIWLKFMQVLNGTEVVSVRGPQVAVIEGTQDSALWKMNLIMGENDRVIERLQEHFHVNLADFIRDDMPPKIPGGTSRVYWEQRYASGDDSGVGSYNMLAKFKADVVNAYILKNNIQSVIEWGCGDGNQLRFMEYPMYVGLDVSQTAVQRCRELYADDPRKMFYQTDDYSVSPSDFDMSVSLDVIYHLTEDDVFAKYMDSLFGSSRRYVCIYSCNTDGWAAKHVRKRKFTEYIDTHFPEWKLTDYIPNRYPYDCNDPERTSWSDFYFYKL
jgi:hypothetical protein